jgi:hypothetical protein
MTPDESLASHRAFLAELGEDIAVRRYSGIGAARTFADTVTRARVMGYEPKDLVARPPRTGYPVFAGHDGGKCGRDLPAPNPTRHGRA